MTTLPGSLVNYKLEYLNQLLHARMNLAVAMPNLIDYIVDISFNEDAPTPVRFRSTVAPGRPSNFPVQIEDAAEKLDAIVHHEIDGYRLSPNDSYRCEVRNNNSFAWVPTKYSRDFVVYISLEGKEGRSQTQIDVFKRAFEGSVSANAEHISPLARVVRQVSTGEEVRKADLEIVDRMPEFIRRRAADLPNGSELIAGGI